jgi:ADP-ribose pyrophosphatase YjhB (NUDIX family)
MPPAAAILARGPWPAYAVDARWSDDHYQPPPERAAAADEAIAALHERGSPSHDGLAARLVGFEERGGGLRLDLQPMRWALRLVANDASHSLAALCVTRRADGAWLAGRRAAWLSTWPGRWALGAGGAVDLGESPAHTLARELEEEWALRPAHMTVEALIRLPHELVMLVGQAWLAEGAEEALAMDAEHDTFAWWPPDPAHWPPEGDGPLLRMAALLTSTVVRT